MCKKPSSKVFISDAYGYYTDEKEKETIVYSGEVRKCQCKKTLLIRVQGLPDWHEVEHVDKELRVF